MKTQIAMLVTGLAGLALVSGCDMNKVDPGGGAATKTRVTVRTTIGPDTGVEDTQNGTNPVTPTATAGPGSLVGTIKFQGAAPVLSAKAAKGQPKDPTVCAKDAAIPDESLMVSSGGGLKNVFIYMKKKPKSWKGEFKSETPILFDQKHCIFTSHALIVPVKYDFKIGNGDSVAHNVNFSGAVKNPKDNFSVSGGTSVDYALKRSENSPFRINCDIHSWMDAYMLPLDHPFAAITDDEGNFTIPDVPSGEYDFRIWHERGNTSYLDTVKINVTAGDPTRLDKSYDKSAFKNLP
jgi:hypothetical protein